MVFVGRNLLTGKKLPIALGLGVALAVGLGYAGLAMAGAVPGPQVGGSSSGVMPVHTGQIGGGTVLGGNASSGGLTPQQKQQRDAAVAAQGQRSAPVGSIAHATGGSAGPAAVPPAPNNSNAILVVPGQQGPR